MINIEKVSYSYGSQIVVNQVNLSLPNSGIISIIGPNGAGKSTLLSMMSRLLNVDQGQIFVDGLDVHQTENAVLAKIISILRQDNYINAKLTVRDLVSFGRYPYSQGRLTAQDEIQIDQSIAYLNLNGFEHRFLDELSGGQRQRAFVAMVLCQDTPYVFLDEPLNNLDMPHAVAMMKQIRKAADELKKTFILVIHDINFASCYSDYIVAMRQGSVIFEGKPDQMMNSEVLYQIYDLEIEVHQIGKRRIAVYY